MSEGASLPAEGIAYQSAVKLGLEELERVANTCAVLCSDCRIECSGPREALGEVE